LTLPSLSDYSHRIVVYATDAAGVNKENLGNFWSDYCGTDADTNMIGDTPYIIDESNQDNFPIVKTETQSFKKFSSTVDVLGFGNNSQTVETNTYSPIKTTTIQTIPEFHSWVILSMSVLITTAIIVSKNRLKKHNKI